eukprot:9468004-Pyramimonas_sp.AAC.1
MGLSGRDDDVEHALSIVTEPVRRAYQALIQKNKEYQQPKQEDAPELKEEEEEAKEKPGEEPRETQQKTTEPQRRLLADVLDQGGFGLCSEYALATTSAHVLRIKFNTTAESKEIFDSWMANGLPPKVSRFVKHKKHATTN